MFFPVSFTLFWVGLSPAGLMAVGTRGAGQGECGEVLQADPRRAGYTEPTVPLNGTGGPQQDASLDRRKVPEGLKASPSGGPNGSTTSHGTRTAYRFPYALA